MNRLTERLGKLKDRAGKAFIAYIMAGEPSWAATKEIVLALEQAGVSAVELGVPFSDPIADGPVIQAAGARALAQGVTLPQIFHQVEELRRDTQIPLLLMGYWNVFLQFGREATLQAARDSGVDGFIIADLPPEAEPVFFEQARAKDLCTVLLASSKSTEPRLQQIAGISTGFIYYVPQTGITGLTLSIGRSIRERLGRIRALSATPVCVGIGVKSREDVRQLFSLADGVIVGTRIVEFIEAHRDDPHLAKQTAALIKGLLP